MKGKRRMLAVLIVAVALLMAFFPATGLAGADITRVSGLECAYVSVPRVPEIHGQTLHIADQIHRNLFFSDDPAIFPNGTNTAHLDITINMVTGQATVFAAAVIQPDGAAGSWEGHGVFLVDTLTGQQMGHGVFRGTGEFAGLRLVMEVTSGNPADCPALPGFMSAGRWSAFIVPVEP